MVKREERLTKVLARTTRYEWIVIDCPPMLGVLTTNALAALDLIIIPCPTSGMGRWMGWRTCSMWCMSSKENGIRTGGSY